MNGGNINRPSVLDILQYNREQQKPFERTKDDEIEQFLLSHGAKNRCSIRRIFSKRKNFIDHNETIISNLACLSLDLATNGDIETARSHARMATSLQEKGDLNGAQENYQQAMNYTPNNTLDWATYAYQLAIIYIIHGQKELALELFQKAIDIRKQIEENSQEILQLQRAIENIQST